MLTKSILFCSLICPVISMGQETIGDSTILREVIISENRLQTPFNKNVRNIQIITKQEIEQLPVKSINEVLSFIGGVDVRQRGPFGAQADISIDGGSFEQTLILLNGIKVSDPQTAHHSMNIPVSLENVERIEILKGPAARIYGINALTGAVNIVTTKPEQSTVSAHAYAGSSFEGKEENDGEGLYWGGGLQVSGNLAFNTHQHVVSISKDKYNGQRYNSSTENTKIFYQGRLQIDERNALDLTAGYLYNEFGANGFYAAPGDRESYEIVETKLVGVSSSHQISDRFSLRPRLSYRYNADDYRYFRHDLNTARSQHHTDVLSAEVNSIWNTSIGDIGFGLESRSEEIGSTNIGDHHRYNHGVYAEFKTERIKNMIWNVGSYLNYNTQYGWQVFPGVDVGYLFHPGWKLAFNIGSSQRIPSFTDLYLDQRSATGGNIGNPHLESENAWQYEFALHYKKSNLELQTGYFYRDISGFIDRIRESTDEPYQPFNFGNNKMQGFNFRASQAVPIHARSRFQYTLSYNYLTPVSTVRSEGMDSKYSLESLKHQLALRTTYTQNQLSVSFNNRLLKREQKAAYLITDLRIGYDLPKITFYTDITNLFNQHYVESAAVPMPRRWFALGARYRLAL